MENNAFTKEELIRLRQETAGAHRKIFFNNAGSSLPPDIVVETVINFLKEEAVEGGYEMEARYQQALQNVYALIAQLINADPDEIAILENASQAWGMAFRGLSFDKGDAILTSEFEYVSNVLGLIDAKHADNVELKVIPLDEQANFSLSKLEELITPKTKLIAVTHISSSAGGVLPIVEIGRIAKKHNILYMVDACQSVGQTPVDVKEIGCDILSATGRKFLRAPRGTGFLFISKKAIDRVRPHLIDGSSIVSLDQNKYKLREGAKRFELYESSRALRLGLGKAVEYAMNIGVGKIWTRIQFLAGILRKQLSAIPGLVVADLGNEKCGIVTFSVPGISSADIHKELALKNISVSVTGASATLFYMKKHGLEDLVRASIHYYNTEGEIETFCNELLTIIRK